MDAPFPPGMLDDIERFFKIVHPNLERGRLLYPEVFATDLFFPLQRQRELRRMMEIAETVGQTQCPGCENWDPYEFSVKDRCPTCGGSGKVGGPKVVMEIGADKGGSLYHWCMLPTVERVIACEVRGTPYWHFFERAFPQLGFRWLERSSRDPRSLTEVKHWLGDDRIDCLFIDGEKPRMYDDFVAYLPYMNRPSVVFVHDINDSYGRVAVERTRQDGYVVEEVIDVGETEVALERQRHGHEPCSPHEAWLRHWKGKSCGVGVVRLS